MVEYYELVKRKIEEEPENGFSIVTAAVWSCSLCADMIDGMGGPGNGEICVKCGDLILSGQVALHERGFSTLVAEYRNALRNRQSVVAQLSQEELLQIQSEFREMPEISGGPDQIGDPQIHTETK